MKKIMIVDDEENIRFLYKEELEDTGGGIDPENLRNIFNPFYSTKDAHLGLGLPIVHKIIISHRGRIEVDNHPGEGATFIITLPAWESTTSTDARVPQQSC